VIRVDILVIDVGGSRIKVMASNQKEPIVFDSEPEFTPTDLVREVKRRTAKWEYEVVSLGYPGVIGENGPREEPGNLGQGWIDFDFVKAFEKPVRVVNDASMQALGAYTHGRMLFLGLGTGLGAALIADRMIVSLELGCLPCAGNATLFDRLGKQGLEKHGFESWYDTLTASIKYLRRAFLADYIVLGGGNAEQVDPLPEATRRGGNEDAFTGGYRLWEEWVKLQHYDPHGPWRVLR